MWTKRGDAKSVGTLAQQRRARPRVNDFGGYSTDFWQKDRPPDTEELVNSFRETAYACSILTAVGVSSVVIRLYSSTPAGSSGPKAATGEVGEKQLTYLRQQKALQSRVNRGRRVDEIVEHPALDLLEHPNTSHSGTDLLELLSLYSDIMGEAYLKIDLDPILKIPMQLWPLPTHLVTVKLDENDKIIYTFQNGRKNREYTEDELVVFLAPNLRNPYLAGLGALEAIIQTFRLMERDNAYANATMRNRARPDIIASPASENDIITPENAEKTEQIWNRKLQMGENGKFLVSTVPMKFEKLAQNARELEAIARAGLNEARVCNAFSTPIALIKGDKINRATLDAALVQHARYAIVPRVRRIVERLNHRILPLFDNKLFFWYDNPIPEDEEKIAKVRNLNLFSMYRTINEERDSNDLPPVKWGDRPWAQNGMAQVDENNKVPNADPSPQQDPKKPPKPQGTGP